MTNSKATKELSATALHENAERIARFIDLTSSHRFIASYGCGSSTLLLKNGEDLKKKITRAQIEIVQWAFEIMKTLLPALKKMKSEKSEQDPGLQASLELQWTDFTAALSMFSHDLKTLFRINSSTSRSSSPAWTGVHNGVHTPPGTFAMEYLALQSKDAAKEENKPAASRMEDSIRKTEMIIHALKAQISVQVWTVENFSSFKDSISNELQGRIPKSLKKFLTSKHAAAFFVFVTTAVLVVVLMQVGVI